jgi:hypothetical protein
MGCKWTTRGGKRIRTAPVGGARVAVLSASLNVLSALMNLDLSFVEASPKFTREELREATLTLWHDPELGYFIQAKMTPLSPSIYHSITTAEATAFQAGRYSGNFIARMFHPVDPVANSN